MDRKKIEKIKGGLYGTNPYGGVFPIGHQPTLNEVTSKLNELVEELNRRKGCRRQI